jgi:hypothetical protein
MLADNLDLDDPVQMSRQVHAQDAREEGLTARPNDVRRADHAAACRAKRKRDHSSAPVQGRQLMA